MGWGLLLLIISCQLRSFQSPFFCIKKFRWTKMCSCWSSHLPFSNDAKIPPRPNQIRARRQGNGVCCCLSFIVRVRVFKVLFFFFQKKNSDEENFMLIIYSPFQWCKYYEIPSGNNQILKGLAMLLIEGSPKKFEIENSTLLSSTFFPLLHKGHSTLSTELCLM